MDISVIIPTRDRSLFLEDSVRSVLLQTRTVHEILVVDDGSREEERDGIDRVISLSPRIRLVRIAAPGGVSAARNVGLEQASGDAILFLDDDDLLHPRMTEECARLLEQEPAVGVVSCLYEMFFTPGGEGPWIPAALLFNPRLLDRHPLRLVDATNVARRKIFEQEPFAAFLRFLIPIHTCMIRRSAVGGVRFPEDLLQGEDTYFFLSLARQGRRFRRIEKTLALVRRHGGNTTRSRQRYFEEIPAFYHRIKREGMVTTRADRFLVNLKLAYFAKMRGDWSWLRHALKVGACPDLLAQEVAVFGVKTLRERRQLLKYYFHQ